MPTPTIMKKKSSREVPKKMKIGLNGELVEDIRKCKQKASQLKKALKGTDYVLQFTLDEDIEKSIRSLVKKYEKTLDKIIAEEGITFGKKNHPPQTATALDSSDVASSGYSSGVD